MESTDILIIILMFAMPIVSAMLDRRKKARKKAEQAARRQFQRPEPFEPFTSEDVDLPEEDMKEEDSLELEPEPAKTYVFEPSAEAPATIPHIKAETTQESEESAGKKERIDVRKLIVYDAIMNPKFKEYEV